MLLAVISDLHLGSKDIDQFQHDDYEFIRFLKFLEKNFEKIILLGDIFETLMCSKFYDHITAFKDAQQNHKEINQRFRYPKYSYVFGNHDLVAERICNASQDLIIEDGEQKLYFAHGHQFDQFLNKFPFTANIGTYLGGMILRWGFKKTYQYFHHMDEIANKNSQQVFEQLAILESQKNQCNVVLTGHDHAMRKKQLDNVLFLNSGTCSQGRINFLSIDTQTQKYDLNYCW